MEKSTLYRLSALACILSGFCIIAGKVLALMPDPQAGEVLDFFSPLFGLFAVIGVYLRQRRQTGKTGGIAFILLFAGLAFVTCLDYFGAFMRLQLPQGSVDMLMESSSAGVFIASGLTFLTGVIMFGAVTIAAGIYPRAATLMFTIGFIPVPLIEVFPFAVVAAGSVLAGAGLVWWGIALWRYPMDCA